MSKLDPYKLTIKRNEDILDNGPIIPRCYEVTYLKSSNSMSIIIDKNEDKSKNIYRGEGLCGRWCCENDKYMLFFQINVISKKKGYDKVKERDKVIREELPLMINAIRKTEEKFLGEYKDLDNAEIFIKFNSLYDDFYKVENWGKLRNYIDIDIKDEKTIREGEINNKLIKQQNKIKMNESLILNFLYYHIELFLFPMYGKDVKFLINDMNILNIEEVNDINGIGKNHEIVVSVKLLGRVEIEEILLNIVVKRNKVLIKPIV